MKPLSLNDVMKLFTSQWKLFSLLSILGLFITTAVYIFSIPYVASGTVLSHDSQNSGLQSFTLAYSGFTKSLQEGKRGNTGLVKQVEFLKTAAFNEKVENKILERLQGDQDLSKDLEDGAKQIKEMAEQGSLRSEIAKSLKVSLDSDFEIKVASRNLEPQVAVLFADAAVESAYSELLKKEASEISKIESFLEKQIVNTDENLKKISQKLAVYQNSEKGILPLASQDRMNEYVSELLVREQELKLKMAENNKLIQILGQGRTGSRESRLYGIGGKIEALRLENSVLQTKLGQTQAAIDKMKQQTKALPFEKQMYDDLKKKSELEFARYKELAEAQAKLNAQKMSLESRYEIFRVPHISETKPAVSLWLLYGAALMLAQLIGSLIVYVKYLWSYEEVIAQASRDVMIFENHPMDPRVIIENSKIKFSLNKMNQQKDVFLGDQENSEGQGAI